MEIPLPCRRLVALSVRSLAAAIVLVLWIGVTQAAQAATIVVNSAADGPPVADEFCTLREAIYKANGDPNNNGCAAGEPGPDTITFALGEDAVITLILGQLPVIENEITIVGQVTVDANQAGRHLQIDSSGVLTLDGLRLVNGNPGVLQPGGSIYVKGGRLALINTELSSNIAIGNGGGIYNLGGQVTLTNARILSNTASIGGGFFNMDGGQVSVNGGEIRANEADFNGGGFANTSSGSQVTLTGTRILSNKAVSGGGFYNDAGGQVMLIDTRILSNTASLGGGFFNMDGGQVSVDGGEIRANEATFNGGGFVNFANISGSQVTLTNTLILSNTANEQGGGFVNLQLGQVSMSGGQLRANTANTDGGGFATVGGQVTLTSTLILSNKATNQGGGFFNTLNGEVTVSQSCIVGNSDVAVVDEVALFTGAKHNWWGAPNGPSDKGPGDGDSISDFVVFDPYLTTLPEACLSLSLHKTVTPAGTLLPGQPVTYTLVVSNTGELALTGVTLEDQLPAGFDVQQTTPPPDGEGPSWSLGELGPGEVKTVEVRGKVTTTLSSDQVLTNTAVLSSPLLAASVTSVVSNPVNLPRLSWAAPSVGGPESTGSLTFRAQLSPANPYAAVTVGYASQNGSALADADYGATSGTLTFAPGVSEQTVAVSLVNDELVELDEAFALTLSNPQGALLLNESATGVILNDDQASLEVEVQTPAQTATLGQLTSVTFIVRLNGSVDVPVAVEYATQDGTAKAGEDYTPESGTLTFSGQSGETHPVVVAVNPERSGQPAEQFSLALSNVQAQGRNVTLVNDGVASVTLPGEPEGTARQLFLPHLQR